MSGVSDFGISSDDQAGTPGAYDPSRIQDAEGSTWVGDGTVEDLSTRSELAGLVRRLVKITVSAPLEDQDLAAANEVLRPVTERLESLGGGRRRMREQPDPTRHPQDLFPTSPVIGPLNPIAPPVELSVIDGKLHGTARFDDQYEGPPSCVHGGIIALVFDEMLGAAAILERTPGMTGTLTIRYSSPTPLRQELHLAA